MNNNKKKELFEAFLLELLEWYKEKWLDVDNNDLSRLKVLKLLFLGVSKNKKALDIFNNFQAWALWPVEKDIYDLIKKDKLDIGIINNVNLKLKNRKKNFSKDIKELAKDIVNTLKEKNNNLIKLSASTLVDITHKWNSWELSRSFNMDKISKKLILEDDWYFN